MGISTKTRYAPHSLGVLLFLIVAALTSSAGADVYSGSLSYDADLDAGLNATDGWRVGTTAIAWEVTVTPSNVHYEYTFSVASKEPSHMILEVTEDAPIIGGFDLNKLRDFRNFNSNITMEEIHNSQLWTGTGTVGSNPYMPDGGIFGIKFDGDEDSVVWTIEFDSDRLPMWGDFYAKDGMGTIPGTDDTEFAAVWNSGFGTFVDAPYWSTDVQGKILVPNGTVVPVPGAALLGFLGLGAAGMKLRKCV